MSEHFKLPILIKNPLHYLGLWIILVILSVAILSFPLNVSYEYSSVESVLAIGKMMPLFALTFYVWFAALLVLLFFSGERNDWHKLALLGIFALVFGGLWIINTPNGMQPDVWMHFGNINYIIENGRLVFGNPALGYLEFPALHIINAVILVISGLDFSQTMILYLLFSFALLSGLLFLFVKKCTGNSYLAALGVLLIIMGSVAGRMLAFWPGNPSFLLMVMLLIWLLKSGVKSGLSALVMIILMAGFVITYLPDPIYFIFFLSGIYFLQMAARKSTIALTPILLFLVLFIVWQLYWAFDGFKSFAAWAKYFIEGLTNIEQSFNSVALPLGQSLGGITPFWAIISRYVWMGIFAIGGILGLRNLLKFKKINSTVIRLTGGLVGAVIFTIICAVTFGVQAQWVRFQEIGPLFLIPILLIFIAGLKFNKAIKTFIVMGLILIVLAFSLPTFLLVGKLIDSNNVYTYETTPLTYFKSAFGGDNVVVNTDAATRQMYFTYLYQTSFNTYPSSDDTSIAWAEIWDSMKSLAENFASQTTNNNFFIINDTQLLTSQYQLSISSSDPNWLEIVHQLEKNDQIYDNGHVQIYQSLSGVTK